MTTTTKSPELLEAVWTCYGISIQCAGMPGNYFETTGEGFNKVFNELDEHCTVRWDYDGERLTIHEIIEN